MKLAIKLLIKVLTIIKKMFDWDGTGVGKPICTRNYSHSPHRHLFVYSPVKDDRKNLLRG